LYIPATLTSSNKGW
jgi:hypothetical protein